LAKIFVVEDDEGVRVAIVDTLEFDGHDVFSRADAQYLINEIKQNQPDLLLLDLMLGADNGLEALSEIRSDPELAKLRVIVVSGRSTDAEIATAIQAGADDYLVKPWNGGELEKIVNMWIKTDGDS